METESRAHAELTAKLQTLTPGSPRHDVVKAAHKFKASWLELASQLSRLQASKAFAGWGYASFADYCRKELHIREQTADKLTRSYGYLRERAPATLHASGDATQALPPLDVVSLLSQARERTNVSSEALAALEGEVLGGDGGHSRGQLLRKLRKMDPEAFAGKGRGASAGEGEAAEGTPKLPALPVDAHQLRKVVLLAERLESLLTQLQAGLDEDLTEQAASLSRGLRARLGRIDGEDVPAAAARNATGELPPAAPMH